MTPASAYCTVEYDQALLPVLIEWGFRRWG